MFKNIMQSVDGSAGSLGAQPDICIAGAADCGNQQTRPLLQKANKTSAQ